MPGNWPFTNRPTDWPWLLYAAMDGQPTIRREWKKSERRLCESIIEKIIAGETDPKQIRKLALDNVFLGEWLGKH